MGSLRAMPGARRAAWLEIDLDAIVQNVDVFRTLVGPGVAIAPVVKAEAYGHGLVEVGRALDGRVEALCVATLDEGIALREAGLRGRLVVLYPVPAAALPEAAEAGIEPTAMSLGDVEAAERASRGTRPLALHLAIETGFQRGGLPTTAFEAVTRRLARPSTVRVASIWTHLARPADAAASAGQVRRFDEAADRLRSGELARVERHIASTSGIVAGSAPAYEMIRPGLGIYGELDPSVAVTSHLRAAVARLRPAMTLRARPAAVADVLAGEAVGYGGTWRAPRPSRIATLPVGYADGYARGGGPGAEVLVRGRRVPVVGTISMDSMGVDVTDVPGVDLEDDFVLLGRQGDERITVAELARRRNTISWEVLAGIASRLTRVYHPVAGRARSGSRRERRTRRSRAIPGRA